MAGFACACIWICMTPIITFAWLYLVMMGVHILVTSGTSLAIFAMPCWSGGSAATSARAACSVALLLGSMKVARTFFRASLAWSAVSGGAAAIVQGACKNRST